jgi:MFS family permease
VLMLCYTLSFVDRQILGLLVPFIKADLKINDTLVGLLAGTAFALFYAVMGLPLGRVADSANRRNLISISIAFWSIFTAACALARSYTTLFLARVGVGVGEAGLNPASFSILSDLFPKERLGAALSVFYIGNLLGSSLALIVGGTVVQAVTRQPEVTLPILGAMASWRLTFLILGLPGLFFALLVFTVKEPIRKKPRADCGRRRQAQHCGNVCRDPVALAVGPGDLGGLRLSGRLQLWIQHVGAHVFPSGPRLDHRPDRTRPGIPDSSVWLPGSVPGRMV